MSVIWGDLENFVAKIRKMADIKQRKEAENQIYVKMEPISYSTKEYPLEVVIERYDKGAYFVTEHRAEPDWNEEKQAKFIEAVLLGFPIPFLILGEEPKAKWEIINGSQRVRALSSFFNGQLTLKNMDVLDKLNGFTFHDLLPLRQKKFKRRSIRLIELSKAVPVKVKKDILRSLNPAI